MEKNNYKNWSHKGKRHIMSSRKLCERNGEIFNLEYFILPNTVWPPTSSCRHLDAEQKIEKDPDWTNQNKMHTCTQKAEHEENTHSPPLFRTLWQWSMTWQSVSISIKVAVSTLTDGFAFSKVGKVIYSTVQGLI